MALQARNRDLRRRRGGGSAQFSENVLCRYNKIAGVLYEGMEANVKIRYKDKGSLATLHPRDNQQSPTPNPQPSTLNKMVNVRFFEDAKGVAPGQSAVFYEGEDVIGGGLIQRYHPAF